MRLEEFLQAIKQCPDKEATLKGRTLSLLTLEHGIYDNWPIFLKAPYQQVIRDIHSTPNELFKGSYVISKGTDGNSSEENSRRLKLIDQSILPDNFTLVFDYKPGTILFQAANFVFGGIFYDQNVYNQSLKYFNMTIMLHPYQPNTIPGVHRYKVMVDIIDDICSYAVKNKFPICLPKCKGWRQMNDEQDYLNKVVFHPKNPGIKFPKINQVS